MSYIVVTIFDREDDAGNVHDFLRDSNLIDLNDSAVIHKDLDGKVHIKNETYLGKRVGAVGGGALGLLIGGLIFPVGGLVIGAIAGGLLGKKVSPDIDKGFVKEVSEQLSPGSSAIFIIVREDTPDDALETMKQYKGKLYYTSLPTEAEAQLRQAMSGLGDESLDEFDIPDQEPPSS
jgi:uncharacterized membrane protein